MIPDSYSGFSGMTSGPLACAACSARPFPRGMLRGASFLSALSRFNVSRFLRSFLCLELVVCGIETKELMSGDVMTGHKKSLDSSEHA